MNTLTKLASLFIAAAAISASGCASGSYAAKGAAQGATSGAVAGAVGGMVSALVFGGDVVEAGARGAVYGGTTGAVVGGMSGSRADKAAAQQRDAEEQALLDDLQRKIGPDAFNGVVALAECKHAVAIANAREAANSSDKNFALAGTWLESLVYADQGNMDAASAVWRGLVERDRDIKTADHAESAVMSTLQGLRNTRVEHGLPATCD